MGMKQCRRLAGACLLLPMAAWAQQGGGHGGWWGQVKDDGPVAAQHGEGTGTEELHATVPEPAGPAVPLDRATLASFECVEVRRFETASGGFIASKEEARAATIPAGRLLDIQRSVAGQVPMLVVDGFEVVDVQQGHRDRPAFADAPRELMAQQATKGARVQGSGQIVGLGERPQRFARAVEHLLEREGSGIERYVNELCEHSPFKA